jgi:hypothetical protein
VLSHVEAADNPTLEGHHFMGDCLGTEETLSDHISQILIFFRGIQAGTTLRCPHYFSNVDFPEGGHGLIDYFLYLL